MKKNLCRIGGITLILSPEPIITLALGTLLICLSHALPEKRRRLANASGVIIRNGFLPR